PEPLAEQLQGAEQRQCAQQREYHGLAGEIPDGAFRYCLLRRPGRRLSCGRSSLFRTFWFSPDRLAIETQRARQTHMLGAWPAARITPLDEQYLVTGLRPAITAHHGDMCKNLGSTVLRLDETEALVVIPAFQAPLALGIDHGCAVLQSIRCNCQVARISRPKA